MKQLVFIDKDRSGKDRTFTTTKEGKMLFPHKDLKIDFDPITVLDNFKVVSEKSNYGFFTGRKIDVCLPEPKDLIPHIDYINSLEEELNSDFYVAGSFYMISNKAVNILITQEVDSGEVLIIEEHKLNFNTRTSRNPHYYAIYNSITTLGKELVDFAKLALDVYLSKDEELSVSKKASLALSANFTNPCFVNGVNAYSYTYYNKCVIAIDNEYQSLIKMFYIGNHGETKAKYVKHDDLVAYIKSGIIKIANPCEYKDAVDRCFEEGFGLINKYSFRQAKDVYEDITGRDFDEELFGRLDAFSEENIYVLNIDKYDFIKETLTDDEIKALARNTKLNIQNIDNKIKHLGKCATKEAIERIQKLNYKRAITITI